MLEIASVHGRNISQIENALKHGELVYWHTQKSQLIISRLQLPSSLLTDSAHIITNENIKSNKKTKKETLLVRRTDETQFQLLVV